MLVGFSSGGNRHKSRGEQGKTEADKAECAIMTCKGRRAAHRSNQLAKVY